MWFFFNLLGISSLNLDQFLFLLYGLFLILSLIDLCEVVRVSDIIYLNLVAAEERVMLDEVKCCELGSVESSEWVI